MKRSIGWIPLLLAVVISLTLLVAVRSGWASYGWNRFVNGGTVVVSEHCLMLPSKWTLVSSDQFGHVVRRHFVGGGAQNFASVLSMSEVAALVPDGFISPLVANGFEMYDLGPDSAGGPIRYIALNRANSIAIIAAQDVLFRELAAGIFPCR